MSLNSRVTRVESHLQGPVQRRPETLAQLNMRVERMTRGLEAFGYELDDDRVRCLAREAAESKPGFVGFAFEM